jgi:hypothetical protein
VILGWLAQYGGQELVIDWGEYYFGIAIGTLVTLGVLAYVAVLWWRNRG